MRMPSDAEDGELDEMINQSSKKHTPITKRTDAPPASLQGKAFHTFLCTLCYICAGILICV